MKKLFLLRAALLTLLAVTPIVGTVRATTPEPTYTRLWPDVAPDTHSTQVPNLLYYLPAKTATPTTAIIIIPGGGYSSIQMQDEGENAADWFKAHGIAAFVMYYRLDHQHPFPLLPMHDGQRAVRWLRYHAAELNLDPHKIGLLGFSAGGHLAATTETHFDAGDPAAPDPIDRVSSRPDFAALVYAVISMQDGITNDFCKKNLLGPNPDPALVQTLSNETQVTPQTPPTILFACADDPLVPIANDRLMYAALQKNGVNTEYHEYPTGGHAWGYGMTPDKSPKGWLEVTLMDWLKKSGFVTQPPFTP